MELMSIETLQIKNRAPILYLKVNEQPYLALARHFGVMEINRHEYYYHKTEDAFIRKDFLKQFKTFNSGEWNSFVEFTKVAEQAPDFSG